MSDFRRRLVIHVDVRDVDVSSLGLHELYWAKKQVVIPLRGDEDPQACVDAAVDAAVVAISAIEES